MAAVEAVFGSNALRASGAHLVLPLLRQPVELIEEGGVVSFSDLLGLVAAHPAVVDACRASGTHVDAADIRYAVGYSAASHRNNFSNRFDAKLFQSFVTLVESRKAASEARAEHDAIMATRPPPTPPPEEYNPSDGRDDNGDDAAGAEDGEDDEQPHQHQHEASAPPPRPRKTRAQRRAEEQQKKDDAKRRYEVEVKEHAVKCLEQKLANAMCADAIRVPFIA